MDRIKAYGKRYKIISGKMINDVVGSYRIFLFLLLFVGGMLAGTLLAGRGGAVISGVTALIDSYKSVRITQSFMANFLNSAFSGGVFMLLCLFLGFSSLGAPLIAVVPFVRGVGMGMICGYLYSAYKLTGLGYCLLLIYPGAVISLLAFLISCVDGYSMSKSIMRVSFFSQKNPEQPAVRAYLNRQGLLLCVTAAAALTDAVTVVLFASFFDFS